MILALDARTIYAANRRGTGKNLIDLYTRLARQRPSLEILAFHRGVDCDDPFADLDNVKSCAIDMPGDRWNLWQHVRLPMACRSERAELLHCPANTAPRLGRTPILLTIHDLIPAEIHAPGWKRWLRDVACSARRAKHIVTPSAYSRDQIVERLGIAAEKITVNPWAPDSSVLDPVDPQRSAAARAGLGLDDRPVVLGFAAEDPRKNTARLVTAWATLPQATGQTWQLVLIGAQERFLPELRRQINLAGVGDSVTAGGFVSQADLAALLTAAEVLCYPSLAEGFGLPVLDAFATRTAVVTSSTTSLPEVAGPAAELVDPADADAIAAGLAGVLNSPARRAELIAAGSQRIGQFTWDHCVRRFSAILDDMTQEAGGET
jgi:glycosyltransferase involved in cell wall biosynthesis